MEQQNNCHIPRKNTSFMCQNPTAGETAEIFLQKKPMLNFKKNPKQLISYLNNNVHFFLQLYIPLAL